MVANHPADGHDVDGEHEPLPELQLSLNKDSEHQCDGDRKEECIL